LTFHPDFATMVAGDMEPVITENLEKEQVESIENEPPAAFTIELLRLIRDWQQQHGLRHGDYQRYRGYCTRRVKRLRKTLHLPQGDRKHFKKRDVNLGHLDSKESDERFIHIPIILAERAWAYAMQLRQESNTEPRKRFHLISKLRKACLYAAQVQELCNSSHCDARSKLEAEAYAACMRGSLNFELSLWTEAAENLKHAQVIYENLVAALPEDEQDVYQSKVDDITPSLRYCAYNMGDSTSIDELLKMRGQGLLQNLDALVAQTKNQSLEALQTTEWRGRKVAVRPERVRLFLISIQDLKPTVDKSKDYQSKIEIIENVLIDCKDAINAVRDEIKQDPKLRGISEDSSLTGIQYLLSYLSYIRLTLTLERNLYLVAQAKQSMGSDGKNYDGKRVRPQDVSRLYEIILQNVTELQQLLGMEKDQRYQEEMAALQLAFKSFRTFFIALTLVHLKRWKEAVAMYERSTSYAAQAFKTNHADKFNLKSDLQSLIKSIEESKFMAQAYSVLEEEAGEEANLYGKFAKPSKPLFERVNDYCEDSQLHSRNPNVFRLTPDMDAAPCKPLFFDLAWNLVELPNLDDKIQQGDGKTGLTRFVKGFLGWGGSGK